MLFLGRQSNVTYLHFYVTVVTNVVQFSFRKYCILHKPLFIVEVYSIEYYGRVLLQCMYRIYLQRRISYDT